MVLKIIVGIGRRIDNSINTLSFHILPRLLPGLFPSLFSPPPPPMAFGLLNIPLPLGLQQHEEDLGNQLTEEEEDGDDDDDGVHSPQSIFSPSIFRMAVPKKKTSHSKKRRRWQHKYLTNINHHDTCPNCGGFRLVQHLCVRCFWANHKAKKRSLGLLPPKNVDEGSNEQEEVSTKSSN